MSKHSDLAVDLFKKGYNCSQSVFAAFCDETGMDFESAIKLSSSFGGGMGRLREVCGAVTGMFMVAGLKYGYDDPNDVAKKAQHYKLIQYLAEEFKEKNSSIICRDLLALTGKTNCPENHCKAHSCAELVEYAAEIIDELIEAHN